jgi:hypothetical protein
MELTQLMQCIASTFGVKVGEAVKAEIEGTLGLQGVDIAALNAKIATIQSLLDADAGTPEFDIAQNLITTITGLNARLATLEGDTRVAAVQAAVASLTSGLAAEVARATAAEAALAAQISVINTTLTSISTQISEYQTGVSNACDCAAITASLAAQSTAIANLQGVDSAQAAQIAAMQATIEGLSVSASSTAAAIAAVAQAAATAQATANAAAAAIANLDTRENEHHNEHGGRLNDHHNRINGKVGRDEVAAIDCVALGNLFAAGLQLGLHPTGY